MCCPLYEYEDSETGIKLELRRDVSDRNKDIVLKRTKRVPDRLLVFGSTPTKEQSFDQNILKGYYRKEQQEGSRFRSGYTKKQLSKAFAHVRAL